MDIILYRAQTKVVVVKDLEEIRADVQRWQSFVWKQRHPFSNDMYHLVVDEGFHETGDDEHLLDSRQ